LSYNDSSLIHISKIIAKLQFIICPVSLSLAKIFVSALNFFFLRSELNLQIYLRIVKIVTDNKSYFTDNIFSFGCQSKI